jgi:FMN-dependent oxidoreductase (nitrilotriacetate monooxygenase family)
LQIPVNDPSLLIPAMAAVTENLGFAFTHSVLQEHPFNFARRVSTLDHLTGGRVAWNIVTSYLETAGRNLGYGGLPAHDERYERADEYVEVVYKLLEGSWEDDAVVRDLERRIYADPAKIHDIDHRGRFYPDVVGPHLSEPSAQRTPVLFQAGSSERGREFAARHAEAVFLASRNPHGARAQVQDVRARAVRHGRDPEDIRFLQGLSVIVGGTEEEAARKERQIDEFASDEGYAAHMAGNLGIDLSEIDLEAPLHDLPTANVQGVVRGLIESAPDHIIERDYEDRQTALTLAVAGLSALSDIDGYAAVAASPRAIVVASWARLRTPSLRYVRPRCASIVLGLRIRWVAASWMVAPSAMIRATRSSCGVSVSVAGYSRCVLVLMPVARSSRRACSAHGSAARCSNVASAWVSCSRASEWRVARPSRSP